MTENSTKFCRFCMCEEPCDDANKLVDVFNCGLANFSEKIKNCTQIYLTPEDRIPPIICMNCIDCIEKVNNFLEMCRKSDKALGDFYSRNAYSGTSQICKSEFSKNALSSEHEVYLPSKDYNVIYRNQKYVTNIEYFSESTSTIQNKSANYDSNRDIDNSKTENDILDDFIDESDSNSSSVNEKVINKSKKSHKSINGEVSLYSPKGKKIKLYDMDESMKKIIGDNVYACNICSKDFTSFFDYQDHQETHNGQFAFSCSKCDEMFSERKKLVDHDTNHKIICDICKIKVLPKSLAAHLQKHTDKHKCIKCNARHSSKAALEKHVKARHKGEKGFVCYICGKQNSCQTSMKRHIAYHSSERPFNCQFCHFSAKSINILKVHTSRKHLGQQCVCDICAKFFKSELSLKSHKKRMHNPRKHICNVCGKAFTEKFNLNNHTLKKHSKQRIYCCKMCGEEFFTVKKLKEHMHIHRQGCASCPTCGKEFFYKKYLEKHMVNCSLGVQRNSSKSCSLRSSRSLPNASWLNEK
ncbi:hypothetical protein NQ314_004452 [Rhamnusium bicolor]|uniref:Uncharacterized protein n=1 Tax=Rhamnusium bicolor TaxID=1586634 RepID=A0AAV8ZK00_9CUCU|nr:hypothetical protein NQ314_004452 [Rhamnusium bicolor]